MSVSFNDVSGYIIILSFYALNCIFFSANETALLSHNNQRLFKEISQIAEKWEISFATFQKPAQCTESIKYLTKLK